MYIAWSSIDFRSRLCMTWVSAGLRHWSELTQKTFFFGLSGLYLFLVLVFWFWSSIIRDTNLFLLIIWFKVALSFVIIKYRRFITKDTDIFVLFINLFICISYCLSDINTPYLMRYHSSLGIISKFRQSNQQISVATF